MSEQELNILVFGQLTDITGTGRLTVPIVHDANALRELLLEYYPEFSRMSYVIAVDKKLVSGNIPITVTSSIALLPPFSGG
ncbi:MoaD/ThiS family protein [Flavihumibacter fluvii]|uniref:MoaD/ThiS family protein n=1 Tax=Flavihumibacter fluvii TaxID=2838157 RepID=UPI001BDE1079|nr:MoaD/ThiS family protein [Flavihumibacter fluvii]ULQ52742.1 MoaD/ThiS family protein [Flavihumibacter fluvii]